MCASHNCGVVANTGLDRQRLLTLTRGNGASVQRWAARWRITPG
jgi:hypothetical protein